MAGGEGNGLDAVSAENDQLRVGRLAVHDQQVQDRHRGAEDLQFLLQNMCYDQNHRFFIFFIYEILWIAPTKV